MATNIFLGYPPENIKQFIIEHYNKPEEPVDMTKVPLHFTAEEDDASVQFVCYGVDENTYEMGIVKSWTKIDYSMDGKTWSTYINPDESKYIGDEIKLNKGETVYFQAKYGNVSENPNIMESPELGFWGFSEPSWERKHKFIVKKSVKADGNIQFLFENTGTKMDVPDMGFSSMFSGCASLTQAPLLPATTVNVESYAYMFHDCTSLTKAPALPATTLTNYCYSNMFNGCTSINNVNVSFSDWNPSDATYNWLDGVAAEGTFTCPEGLSNTPRDGSHIPSGWTRVDKQ